MAMITRYQTTSYDQEIPKKLEDFRGWEFSSGGVTGGDFKHFARLFKKYVNSHLPSGAKLQKASSGHYILSGFIEREGAFVYFSISDVRHFPGSWYENILVRTATSDHDYTGGGNNYTTLERFGETVGKFL